VVAPESVHRWFLVLTKPSSEQLARIHLDRQGFHTYLPRLHRTRIGHGRRRDSIVPLFPRYLFVRLEALRQTLAPIRSTRGVAGIVRFGEQAAEVAAGVIEALTRRADPVTGLHRLESRALRRGMPVSIVGGAFDGLEGIFEREEGDERSVILLSMLGRNTPVRMDSRFVVAA
jgi:transcriptional antiterminator RfaH